MLELIKQEIRATWAGGSRFDRTLMVAYVLFLPYDLVRGNWFDAILGVVVLTWIWQSVKENNH